MLHLVIGALIEDDFLANFVAGAKADGGEEGRHLVVLILCPAFKGMVVALRTDQADTHEDLRRLFHGGLGFAGGAEVVPGGIFVAGPAAGE